MGILYVVATPIGNLEDITLRALRVFKDVALIAAEDTRTTRKLLSHYKIRTPLTSYHEHSKQKKTPELMAALESKDVALVSEAGMPGISDPGYELVLEAIRAGVPVVPIPGPSAVTACMAISGLPAQGFLFVGFLPRRKGQRRHVLESLSPQPHTLVVFEAPHRLRSSLEDMLAVLGDRDIAVCREVTKVYEEVFRGTVHQALDHFHDPRGEFTLVVAGAPHVEPAGDLDRARDELRRLMDQGSKTREAVGIVARDTGSPKKELYRLWLEISGR